MRRGPAGTFPTNSARLMRGSFPTKKFGCQGGTHMTEVNEDRRDLRQALSRRHFVQALGAGASAVALGAGAARAQAPGGPGRAAEHGDIAAARLRPERRAEHLFLGPGRHRRRSELQRSGASPTRRSSGCGPARCGRRARPGMRRGATWSGATSPTTGNCDGSRTTAASACSGSPSNNSNGNTFDFQGRQLSCEHLTRRVVRYELDGSVTRASPTTSTASG